MTLFIDFFVDITLQVKKKEKSKYILNAYSVSNIMLIYLFSFYKHHWLFTMFLWKRYYLLSIDEKKEIQEDQNTF